MTEPKPLGLFADLLKWKLASRLVVGLVVFVAALFSILGFAAGGEGPSSRSSDAAAARPAILLLTVVFPPLLASLYVQWAMFVRRARGQ